MYRLSVEIPPSTVRLRGYIACMDDVKCRYVESVKQARPLNRRAGTSTFCLFTRSLMGSSFQKNTRSDCPMEF